MVSYFQSNNLISPNYFTATWFLPTGPGRVILNSLVIITCYVAYNASQETMTIIYSVLGFFCLFTGAFIIWYIAYMSSSINYLCGFKHCFGGICSFLVIVFIYVQSIYKYWFQQCIILFGLLLFIIIKIINVRYIQIIRNSLQKIDNINSLTLNDIGTTFSPFNSTKDIHQIMKLGLISDSQIVCSPQFLAYILTYHSDTPRLDSYVVFIYSTKYGGDPDIYRYFMHLLSVNRCRFTFSFYLFQYIMAYMQGSHDTSPIISRDLENYRKDFAAAISKQYDLWDPGATGSLYNGLIRVNATNQNFLLWKLNMLNTLYPFNPSVLFERSIIMCDIRHDIKASSQSYEKGIDIAENGGKAIARMICENYHSLFPLLKPDKTIARKLNSLTFISFFGSNNKAKIQATPVSINDPYITSIGHVYEIEESNIDKANRPFRGYAIILMVLTMILIIIEIIQYVNNWVLCNRLVSKKNEFDDAMLFLNETLSSKSGILSTYYDALLLIDLFDGSVYNYSTSVYGEIDIGNYYFYLLDNFRQAINLTQYYRTFYFSKLKDDFISFSALNSLLMQFNVTDAIELSNSSEFRNQLRQTVISIRDNIHRVFLSNAKILISDYNEIPMNLLPISISAIVLCSLGVFLCILIKSIIDVLITKKIADLASLIQPAVKKQVRHQFRKAVDIFGQQTEHKTVPFRTIIILIISFVLLIIIPISVVHNTSTVWHDASNDSITFNITAPDTLAGLEIYKIMAMIDFHSKQNDTKIMIADSSPAFSPHKLVVMNTMRTQGFDFFDKYTIDNIRFFTLGTNVLSSIIFMFFLFYAIQRQLILYNMLSMIYFVPPQITIGNPIASALIENRKVSSEEIHQFCNDARSLPAHCQRFTGFELDSDGQTIINTFGDVEGLFGERPANLTELKNLLIDPKESFFDRRCDESIFTRNRSGMDLHLRRVAKNQIFVVNEAESLYMAQLIRQIEEIETLTANMQLPKQLDRALVIITKGEFNGRYLIQDLGTIGATMFESKAGQRAFILEFNEEKSRKVAQKMAYYSNGYRHLKIVISGGHQAHFFKSTNKQMPRIVSSDYSIALLMLSKCQEGQVFVSKEFADAIGQTTSLSYIIG